MKRYVYTYKEKTRTRGGCHTTYKTVQVYRITRDDVVLVATLTDTFVCEWQLVLMALETIKAREHKPPKALFERSKASGGYCMIPDRARALKLADIRGI